MSSIVCCTEHNDVEGVALSQEENSQTHVATCQQNYQVGPATEVHVGPSQMPSTGSPL